MTITHPVNLFKPSDHRHWVASPRVCRETMIDGTDSGFDVDILHVEEVLFWESIGYSSTEMNIPMGECNEYK